MQMHLSAVISAYMYKYSASKLCIYIDTNNRSDVQGKIDFYEIEYCKKCKYQYIILNTLGVSYSTYTMYIVYRLNGNA